MLKIELNPAGEEHWASADFALHTAPGHRCVIPDDVGTFQSTNSCEQPDRALALPVRLLRELNQFVITQAFSCRAMVGNAGCELTFRHRFGNDARRNIHHILKWAEQAIGILGSRLVLAPMDLDLIHDVATDCQLLNWAARAHVPLAIFCGYRFLFPADAFVHIRQVANIHPWPPEIDPFGYPYAAIADAIQRSGAEVWTGAGFDEGLNANALELAKRFGFKGVLTTPSAWRAAGM